MSCHIHLLLMADTNTWHNSASQAVLALKLTSTRTTTMHLTTPQVENTQLAFDRAKRKIREQMTAKEFKQFEQISSLDRLVQEGKRIEEELKRETTSPSAHRVNKLASRIEPFSPILQGFCKLAPSGGDLIWGIVSFLLAVCHLCVLISPVKAEANSKMAGSNMVILEEVLEFFIGIAEEVEHLTLVEDTFPESNMVVSATEAVYVALINFWIKAMEFYLDKLKSDIISRIKTWVTSSSIMRDEFAKLKGKITAQKVKLHDLEATAYYASQRAERFRRLRKELSEFLSPPDYEHHFRTVKQYRHNGTCDWLRDKLKYRNWLEDETSSLLIIYGIAGVGKTVLSSWLVDESRINPGQTFTIYHFFKETDDSCNTSLAAMRSLLDQIHNILLSTNHALVGSFEAELFDLSQRKHIHFEALWNVLSSFLSQYSQRPQHNNTSSITIVLDAIDECQDSQELIQGLRRLILATSNNIRVAVTGRPGVYVNKSYREYVPFALLEITQDDVGGDIAAVVKSSIGEIDRFRDPKIFHLRDRVIEELSDPQNHQGMFLWVYFMCREVRRPLSRAQILSLLKDLPKGLHDIYSRICRRLTLSSETNIEFSRRVLRWIVASRRPMTFVELEEALKLTTNDEGVSLGQEFCDENGNLLWSRRDVVKCCGDLVRYSGLDEGDTIGMVHLSAQQFLSTSPVKHASAGMPATIEPFLVDIPSAELSMAIACAKYIISTSPHSDDYNSPYAINKERTPNQEVFKRRYPLFEYATILWTEYGMDAIQSQLDVDHTQQFLAIVIEFARSPISIIWLEELIRSTYIEYAQHTIRRLIRLPSPTDVLRWLNLASRALVEFSGTLSSHPHMAQLCMSQLELRPADRFASIPLEADFFRSWLHYDPDTNNLFSAGDCNFPVLRCQSMHTGERSRPMIVSLDELPDLPEKQDLRFYLVAATTSNNYIVTGYLYSASSVHLGHLVVCWSVNNITPNSSVKNWAKPVFTQLTLSEARIIRINPPVRFVQEDTIVTPRGVFDLRTKQYVDVPRMIPGIGPEFRFEYTLLSGDGRRVARSRHAMLEVLDSRGRSIYRHDFNTVLYRDSLELEGFSRSGGKVVVCLGGSRFCVAVDEAKQIGMPFSAKGPLDEAVFTKNEGRLVARADELLVVWTFLRDEDGAYLDHANIVYVFESHGWGFVFDLVPGAIEDAVEDALIVEGSGKITRQSLDLTPLPRGAQAYSISLPFTSMTWNGFFLELNTWSIWQRDSLRLLRIEQWSLGSPQPIHVSHVEFPIPPQYQSICARSPDRSYIVTETAIIDTHVTTPNGFGVRQLELPGVIYSTAFSFDQSFLACLCKDGDRWTLYVLGVRRGPEINKRASFTFEEKVEWSSLMVSKHNTSLLAVCNYIMRLEDNQLTVEARIDERIWGFSECGVYFYDWHENLYRLADGLVPKMPPPTEIRYLTTNMTYFYPPHSMQLDIVGGIVCLRHRIVSEVSHKCRIRKIWIVSDAMLDRALPIYLIWPHKDVEQMKLLMVLDGGPTLIDTGIQKRDLMKDDEWFEEE